MKTNFSYYPKKPVTRLLAALITLCTGLSSNAQVIDITPILPVQTNNNPTATDFNVNGGDYRYGSDQNFDPNRPSNYLADPSAADGYARDANGRRILFLPDPALRNNVVGSISTAQTQFNNEASEFATLGALLPAGTYTIGTVAGLTYPIQLLLVTDRGIELPLSVTGTVPSSTGTNTIVLENPSDIPGIQNFSIKTRNNVFFEELTQVNGVYSLGTDKGVVSAADGSIASVNIFPESKQITGLDLNISVIPKPPTLNIAIAQVLDLPRVSVQQYSIYFQGIRPESLSISVGKGFLNESVAIYPVISQDQRILALETGGIAFSALTCLLSPSGVGTAKVFGNTFDAIPIRVEASISLYTKQSLNSTPCVAP